MRKEEDCPTSARYLYCDELLSDEGVNSCRQETIRRINTGEYNMSIHDPNVQKYINWERKPNEVVLFTLYAYADLSIPIAFDCLFDIENPDDYTISKFVVTQSLYEGFYPIDRIDNGHKHTIVCSFESVIIPAIIHKLYVGNSYKSPMLPPNCFRMGICKYENYPSISEKLREHQKLKTKYGNEWWKYIED